MGRSNVPTPSDVGILIRSIRPPTTPHNMQGSTSKNGSRSSPIKINKFLVVPTMYDCVATDMIAGNQ